MSWHDKHEQDQDRKTDEAVREEAHSLGGCGSCIHARHPRKSLEDHGVDIVIDCYLKHPVEQRVLIGLGNSCSARRT